MNLDSMTVARGQQNTSVFHRFPKAFMPEAVRGDGPYIVDSQGKRYLDASGGAAVSCLGHSHEPTIKAVQEAVAKLAFAHTSFFTNKASEDLAALLANAAPGDLNHVYFLSGGSEAVETSLKLARQYYVECGMPQRSRIIARRQSYHGNTLGALAAGGNLWRRKIYEPLLVEVSHIAPCYAYREQAIGETEEEYSLRAAQELEAAILEAGPETVMCFIAETVGGATLGAVPPTKDYYKHIREICDKYGVLLILDEVMCGMGRTGSLFAYEDEGIIPDIVCIAKGLGAGYQPIGAVIASSKIYDTIVGGSGFFHHGHTYTAHPTACAAALAVQTAIQNDNLLENVRLRGEQLRGKLEARFGQHRHVGDIRGRGMFLAMEFVADRETKKPFGAEHQFANQLKKVALENGLICYPAGGLLDGKIGDHVLLAPPFILEERHLDEIVEKLAESAETVLDRIHG
ncbi:aspartate aminotransferase family protein [Brucella anthropi]|uniref:aspartate aminotransferase family protein n=1 Tax=Brucella anthropi TaxID=529 RepID=UPI003EDF1010